MQLMSYTTAPLKEDLGICEITDQRNSSYLREWDEDTIREGAEVWHQTLFVDEIVP